jgi:hypothetical protein
VSDSLTTCPCCNSVVRVVPDEARLEIVRIAKPTADEVWRPAARPRPYNALPAPVLAARLGTIEAAAIEVITRVADEEGFSLDELRHHSRAVELVATRWRAAKAAREETGASLPQIGRILDRHHTTVLHGLRQIDTKPKETAYA